MKVLLSSVLFFLCFSCANGDAAKGTATSTSSETQRHTESAQNSKERPTETQPSHQEAPTVFDTIKAPKSGIIDWIAGSGKIKKGRTLFSYDNYERFENLSRKKADFRLVVDSLVANAGNELDPVKKKWNTFRFSLRTDTLLPAFPRIEFREEGMHYGKQALTTVYNEIVALENAMKADFVAIKHSYSNLKWKVKKGQRVKRGQIVAIGKKAT